MDYGLGDLLVEKGDAYEINLQVYYMLRDTITGWPGGKPNVTLPKPSRAFGALSQNVLLSSPLTRMMISFQWVEHFSACTTRDMMYT